MDFPPAVFTFFARHKTLFALWQNVKTAIYSLATQKNGLGYENEHFDLDKFVLLAVFGTIQN